MQSNSTAPSDHSPAHRRAQGQKPFRRTVLCTCNNMWLDRRWQIARRRRVFVPQKQPKQGCANLAFRGGQSPADASGLGRTCGWWCDGVALTGAMSCLRSLLATAADGDAQRGSIVRCASTTTHSLLNHGLDHVDLGLDHVFKGGLPF